MRFKVFLLQGILEYAIAKLKMHIPLNSGAPGQNQYRQCTVKLYPTHHPSFGEKNYCVAANDWICKILFRRFHAYGDKSAVRPDGSTKHHDTFHNRI